MGRKRGPSKDWDEGPKEQVGLGSLEVLALFKRAQRRDTLYRPELGSPGPVIYINPLTGEIQNREEVNTMAKGIKDAPVEEELEDNDEETGEESEGEDKPAKGKRGNPGNLTPREPVKVPKGVVGGLSEEVQKLLRKREKLLAAGDQKGLRKIRAMLRKAGFRLSNYAGDGDKIANAAKAKAEGKEEPKAKKAKSKDDDDDDD